MIAYEEQRQKLLVDSPDLRCSSPAFHHDEMISVSTLDLYIFRITSGARFQVICCFFICSIQRPSDFPAEAASLPSFVFGKLSGYLVKLGTVTELCQCFLLFRVLLALVSIRSRICDQEARYPLTRMCLVLIAVAALSLLGPPASLSLFAPLFALPFSPPLAAFVPPASFFLGVILIKLRNDSLEQ